MALARPYSEKEMLTQLVDISPFSIEVKRVCTRQEIDEEKQMKIIGKKTNGE